MGASQHYLKPIHTQFLQNQTPVNNNLRINLPDGNTITATHKGMIPINKHLPIEAQLAYILPHLTNESLLSVGQFCDYDCNVLFRKRACYIAWNNQIILQGLWNCFDGLWDITLPTTKAILATQQPNFQLNYIVKNDQTKTELTPLKGKAFADRTGQFPHKSSRGNQYLFVLFDYDTNAILFKPLKMRQSKEITNTYTKCYAKLAKTLTTPKLYVLDNECSTDLKLATIQNNAKYELVLPHQHRRNAAEKAIRTLKNHLLSGLATYDNQFPIREWDCLQPQCELTLNLLRNSCINPKLSSWAILNGNHDFNRVQVAPPGAKIVIHNKPTQQKSWQFHGTEGWYIGPAFEHYRCLQCYLPVTRMEIISDTVRLIPSYVPILGAKLDN